MMCQGLQSIFQMVSLDESNPRSRRATNFFPPPPSPQPSASSSIGTSGDGLPPTKRRRLVESTSIWGSSSPLTPRSSSSHPEHPSPATLHDARTASTARLLDTWSSLAERYNRRLDEDDIVDILTGEVIEDRGVLSGLPERYNFGDLANKGRVNDIDREGEMVDNLAEADVGCDDDSSSEDELNLLPPRLKPAKRTSTLARKKVVQLHSRLPRAPDPDTESEDEFAVSGLDQDDIHFGHHTQSSPSPAIPTSTPLPSPPLSLPPDPSSSLPFPSFPPLSLGDCPLQ
jgi:hypothetical protein